MDLYFNNVSPTGIRWNNNVVTEVQYNNVKVWPDTVVVPTNAGRWTIESYASSPGTCSIGDADSTETFKYWNQYQGGNYIVSYSIDGGSLYMIYDTSNNAVAPENLVANTPYIIKSSRKDAYVLAVPSSTNGYGCNLQSTVSDYTQATQFYLEDANDGYWYITITVNGTKFYMEKFTTSSSVSVHKASSLIDENGNRYVYPLGEIVLSSYSSTNNQAEKTVTISVLSGTIDNVTSNAAWLTCTASGGNYNIHADRQTTNANRTGSITFSNSISTATYTYTQNFDASISCTNVSIIQTASTETINVTTVEPVVSITLDSDAQQFITLVTQTLDTSTFVIDIDAYTGTTSRSGNITFNNGYNNAVSTITQTYVAAGCDIECVYNVTSTSSATTILYTTTNVSMIEVNGVSYSPSTSFTFSSTGLQTVKFTTSSSIIPEFMFRNVSALQSCTIYASITTLGHDMFRSSGVVTVTLPEGLTSIGDEVFHDATHMTTFNIPSTVTSLGGGCFNNCDGLTNVVIPDTVTTLGDGCFCWCDNMQSMTISKNATKIPFLFLYGSTCPSITCMATTAPSLASGAFQNFQSRNGTLYVPTGSDYSSWISAMPSGWTVSYINPS